MPAFQMPSKKLITWLVVLIIALGISMYLQRDMSPKIPKMTPEVEKEAMATFDKMMELGKKRKWKEFNKLWVTVPQRDTLRAAASAMGNFRSKFDPTGIDFQDEEAKHITLTMMSQDGLTAIIVLEKKDSGWLIQEMSSM